MTITFFPMIIIAWTIERMSILWEEDGPTEVMKQGGGSLLVAVLAYLLMQWSMLAHLTFNFPELNLVLLALILAMGQYTGYKLSELRRFRAMDEVCMSKAWVSPKHLREYGMLGMNCRNVDFINRYNERKLFPLVDNKLKTKLLAQEYDVPTPGLKFVVREQHEISHIERELAGLETLRTQAGQGLRRQRAYWW